ncbi:MULTISPECIES: site-specific DNA-methyltransferase [unclassified Microbacterium]|uniref:site-specific DNA-methyltransferase n=1 Tax=unclassified Microbacterium TaxID=2609290 RepID=UPI000D019EA0|nr:MULTISPECIES: DNA methyltransferase [unclassified Microbacterium]AVL97577.1 site-specific DNA-methyltransferase [Microbacterium sp. str. 'China']RUQ08335.1 site-specific DNA-methyltransferase [Microbacterium sp. HSID17254]
MSRLSDLLRTVNQLDPQLAKDLDSEIQPLQKRLPFGLNFERHAPEAVELPAHKIRKMSKVRVLPPRGVTGHGDQRIWTVDGINGETADISTPNGAKIEAASVALDDLVLVAEFRDRIYPGLRPDGTIERGGNKPFHTVINGENFHVLEQLTFTHEKSVDAIYIDPPYNTGSRDWKYNNDYVEGDDLYRHSKWLAFMERRLKLAKRLLKPASSVLIVTIDEKEYLRLGLLLEQTFPEARIQMVTSVISSQGSVRDGMFSRSDEYIFFVFMGQMAAARTTDDMLNEGQSESKSQVWFQYVRTGKGNLRADSPNLFFPIFVEEATGRIVRVGAPIPLGTSVETVPVPAGEVAVWPKTATGAEARWRTGVEVARRRVEKGLIRATKSQRRGRGYSIMTVNQGTEDQIEKGELSVTGRNPLTGAAIIDTSMVSRDRAAKTTWNRVSHNAGWHGSKLVAGLLPGRSFPYPKSLYAVEDALRFFLSDKPNAVILDFFAGSGTTAHAVMRLNKQDGGRRQCISVTNNEVSADEQAALRRKGVRPGDPEWEKLGICDYITKPRIRAAITGETPDGAPIKGDYKFVDEFPMAEGFEENAAFFTLTYESKWLVGVDRAFAAIAPMLWLRAGAVGSRIDWIEGGWAIADSYGILRDLDQAAEFVEALRGKGGIRIVYVVTDDEGRYQQVADEIRGVETVRLYEDYLRNCEMTGDF